MAALDPTEAAQLAAEAREPVARRAPAMSAPTPIERVRLRPAHLVAYAALAAITGAIIYAGASMLVALAPAFAPTGRGAAGDIRIFDRDGFACARTETLDAVFNALASDDRARAVQIMNSNDCIKTLKGERYIQTDRKSWTTYQFRRPDSTRTYWTSGR